MVSVVDLIAAKSRLLLRQRLCRIRIQSVSLEGNHTTSYPTVPCTGAHTSAICRCLASTHSCPRLITHSRTLVFVVFRLSAVGSIRGVTQLLEMGQAEVNEIDQHGRSAMHFAAARGDIAMIQVLRSASSRYSPLSYPTKGKNYEPWEGLSLT